MLKEDTYIKDIIFDPIMFVPFASLRPATRGHSRMSSKRCTCIGICHPVQQHAAFQHSDRPPQGLVDEGVDVQKLYFYALDNIVDHVR